MVVDIRSRVDERTAALYDATDMSNWTWEAARDIARKSLCLGAHASFPIETDGRQQYPLPQDWYKMQRVEYVQSSDYRYALEFRTMDEMDDVWYSGRTVQSGQPYFWTFFGFAGGTDSNQVYLYPAPTSGVSIDYFYYRIPRKPKADSDPVEIPAGWEDLVPLYVETICRRKDDDQRWQESSQLYEDKLEALIASVNQPTNQMRQISGMGPAGPGPVWLDGWGY